MENNSLEANNPRARWVLILSPLFVLLVSRVGVEFNTGSFSKEIAWIPSFIVYYFSILLTIFIAKKFGGNSLVKPFSWSFHPVPSSKFLFWGIIFPALLPLGLFVINIKHVPTIFIFYILVFALINSFFEEIYWRGLLFRLPFSKLTVRLISAALFSFSHYFLWGFWLNSHTLIPTLISTFVMGLCWMWFLQKKKNILYLISSHFLVDILNLSVAIFYGVTLQF